MERLPNQAQVQDPFIPNKPDMFMTLGVQTRPFYLGLNICKDHKRLALYDIESGSTIQGTLIINQCQSFSCDRCGGTDISVPNGGLIIVYDVNPATTGSNAQTQTIQQKNYPPQGTITYSDATGTWTCNPGMGQVNSPVPWYTKP